MKWRKKEKLKDELNVSCLGDWKYLGTINISNLSRSAKMEKGDKEFCIQQAVFYVGLNINGRG